MFQHRRASRVPRSTCGVPRAAARSPFARARPSSSTDEAFCTEVESFPVCRASFCQEESSREFVNLRPPPRSLAPPDSRHADTTIRGNSCRNEHCRPQGQRRGVDAGGTSLIRLRAEGEEPAITVLHDKFARECQGVSPRARVNSTPWAPYSAYSAAASSMKR